MNEDYLYSIIGRLYVDGISLQKFIPQLQTSLAAKDKELSELKAVLAKATVVVDKDVANWNTQNENG